MQIKDAVAFVTGGSGGLGSEICVKLAEQGAHVAVGYLRGTERAEATQQLVLNQGRKAITVQIDQSELGSIENAVALVVRDLGSLDILVNNAGIAMGGHNVPLGDLDAFTPEIWDEMMAVNLRGPYLLARAAATHLRSSKWGRIVNIGSTIGQGDWYADRPFAPSKAAMAPLTRFLAASLAPDVAVNCVAPGLMVETALGSGGPAELYERWRDRAALGVTTSVDDVAAQVVTLCCATSMTGQCVVVDGGINYH